MVDARSPDGVVAFLFEDDTSGRKVEAESTLDQKHDGRSLLAGVPRIASLACGMHSPLDLDRIGGAYVLCVLEEVPDQPSAQVLAVTDGVADMPVVRHYTSTPIDGRASRDTVSSSASRRRPSRKANRPSLLHPGSVARAWRPALSRDE